MDAVMRHLFFVLIFLIADEGHTQDQDCLNVNGVCQATSAICDRVYTFGLCNATADIQCCRRSTCVIYGDPHSYTIDYKSYTFNGHCSYYLLSDANYNITADFKACTRHRHVTCLWELTVICDDHNVTFYRNGFVYVDGNLVHLPFQTNDGKVTIYELAPYIILKIECNDIIFILKWLPRHVIIMVPPQLFRATRGLCGTYDYNPDNDFLTPQGVLVDDVNVFGNSWEVPGSC